ncbi:MAG: DUF6445 family protein [Caulobacter sp.]|nr:DUF6445 family protein [Caulobacter sp.]
MSDHAANPARRLDVRRLGGEGEPLAVIDDMLLDPGSLVGTAAQARFAPLAPAGNYYPGHRALAPGPYLAAILEAVRPLLHEVFAVPPDSRAKASCHFSLVTLPPDDLNLGQRLPHIDSDDPGRLAILHYLCGPEHGGTAFYRHRATGLLKVTPEHSRGYLSTLRAELYRDGPPPAGYLEGGTPLFEEIERIPAAFNRLIIYRGCLLHSGIVDPARLSLDPRVGRLTVNTFLTPR